MTVHSALHSSEPLKQAASVQNPSTVVWVRVCSLKKGNPNIANPRQAMGFSLFFNSSAVVQMANWLTVVFIYFFLLDVFLLVEFFFFN
jgi:hypothetical protein